MNFASKVVIPVCSSANLFPEFCINFFSSLRQIARRGTLDRVLSLMANPQTGFEDRRNLLHCSTANADITSSGIGFQMSSPPCLSLIPSIVLSFQSAACKRSKKNCHDSRDDPFGEPYSRRRHRPVVLPARQAQRQRHLEP